MELILPFMLNVWFGMEHTKVSRCVRFVGWR